MTEDAFDHEVWRRSNDLAWRFNWRCHDRALDLMRAAAESGDPEEIRIWTAVEERLRPM